MKYRCRTCKTTCDDIIEHIKKVHRFSESYIENSLKTKSDSYLHNFEKIKYVRKIRMSFQAYTILKIMLVTK